jgi:hypothetical protein
VFRDRTAHPNAYAEYDNKRRHFMTHMQNGRLRDALNLRLAAPQGAPGDVLRFDVQYLTGVALMLDNRPQEAVVAFQQALKSAGDGRPYESANALLLLSDAQRRAGDARGAAQTWAVGADLCTGLAVSNARIADPILMERAAYLRPADAPWPRAAQERLNDLAARMGVLVPPSPIESGANSSKTTTDEAALWTVIGHWRLARDESQAALVAFKRAESMTSDPLAVSQLRLSEARALLRLGQASAATAMLIALAGEPERQVSCPAAAMLGVLKLQQGSTQQGFNLLHRAVEQDQTCVWPERPQAEADLGLAYLLSGDENAGLNWLHSAQRSFEAAGKIDQLTQCLENEAAFLEHSKKPELAKTVRKRLESLQSG